MSGHSKWAKIHRQKGAADQSRGKIFSKLVRNIIVAAKDGADPEMNFKLRLALDKAKAANMPKDNIDKAIARGSGEAGGALIEEVIYEGYGPAGAAVLIETATDNRNRTSSELKNILSKAGGSLSGPNSVKWMFEHLGVLRVKNDQYRDPDEFQLAAIDAGAADVQAEQGGFTIYSDFANFPKLKKDLEAKGVVFDYAALEWIAKDTVKIDADSQQKLEKLSLMLDDNDDVVNYYSNAEE